MYFEAVTLTLASLPLIKSETVLGAYIFHREGDRKPIKLPPVTLTSLGFQQVGSSGGYYRNRYVASDAPYPIVGLSHDIGHTEQMTVTTPDDASFETSALSFILGLYPIFSTLEAPLEGYENALVNSTLLSSPSAEYKDWLQEGGVCKNAVASSNNYFTSDEYYRIYEESEPFYRDYLQPVTKGIFRYDEANFKSAYTIFDFVSYLYIHNASNAVVTPYTVSLLKELADKQEWNLAYNSNEPIRAIAGSVLTGQVVEQLNKTLTGKGSVPLSIQFGDYKPFLSFFGLAQLPKASDNFTSIVDYAASMTFELVTNATNVSASNYPTEDEVSVRFMFANGSTASNDLITYPLFGQNKTFLPWNEFVNEMNNFAVGSETQWCEACGTETGPCAGFSTQAPVSATGFGLKEARNVKRNEERSGRVLVGVISSVVTLIVVLCLLALATKLLRRKLVRKSELTNSKSVGDRETPTPSPEVSFSTAPRAV